MYIRFKVYKYFFPHSIGCLFTLKIVFSMYKFYSLMQFHLFFVFYFIVYALGVISKRSLTILTSRSFIPVFYTKGFMVSGLTL